ncbi:helix-turn-helix domain-containing protein [Acidithiobacillus caldus]|uniref:Cro/CI family transcriptional regulator n=1 Tax=Acidithiobacillus caldus TaxID=33059 RepID=UPI001D0325DD|nr:helix-turn-helix domain-containing protein [Acidithiobacillus caldus]MBU2822335.1 helix-turn-helix domain-containing protein [Acidithiobacillus caldus]
MEPTPSLLLALQIAGSQRALAKLAGVSQPAVHKWVKGLSSPGLKASVQIERATNGAVRCSDLRPDIFGPPDTTPGTGPIKPSQLPLHRRNHDHE